MPENFEKNPILNSPYDHPEHHWELDEDGRPTGAKKAGRRISAHFVPVPRADKDRVTQSDELYLEEEVTKNPIVNLIRPIIKQWREGPSRSWGVTYETERLLKHWRGNHTKQRLFFCQIEAVETFIWLAEVAPRTKQGREIKSLIASANDKVNPDLFRVACKMATGSGKTVVMAMLIAWQVINKSCHPNSKIFSDAFLVITPGITIRDRLRVLKPGELSTYLTLGIVPQEMMGDLQKARIVITNYHSFKLRKTMQLAPGTLEVLQGNKGKLSTTETEGQMLTRVCRELMGRRNIIVINDEAHHCCRHRIDDDGEAEELTGEDKEEAEKNKRVVRLWMSGIEAAENKLRVKTVYDLSATPFFLSGSGYPVGTLFPWVVSDFSLMDAIESGIVKIPRVPIADSTLGTLPIYRNLYKHIAKKLPKGGRGKQKNLDPKNLPTELLGALSALYADYEKTSKEWADSGSDIPPVFIVVCNNTSTSKLVYDYISGYEIPGTDGRCKAGELTLFNNIDEDGKPLVRPRTLLIDSEQLESGEKLSKEFKKLASQEIETFKQEKRMREPDTDVSKISDVDLLREVLNTVGKPGRLGENILCVVSVSMLTEGWDTNTVTHILGIRAFGTQLLCEQVVGRGLRRVNYDVDEHDRLQPEYADVFGVPFVFAAPYTKQPLSPPKPRVHVQAMLDRRELEIKFPHLSGYRVRLVPGENLRAQFTENSILEINPEDAPPKTDLSGIIGEGELITLEQLKQRRENEVVFHLASHTLQKYFNDGEGNSKFFLFRDLVPITRLWMKTCLKCLGGTFPQYLLWQRLASLAVEKIYRACILENQGVERLYPIMNPYNEEGSTWHVNFFTSATRLYETAVKKCHINFAVCDSGWEWNFCEVVEKHPAVRSYVKNHALDFVVPYVLQHEEHEYYPDFIVKIDDGKEDGLLNLIVEIKGKRGRDAEAKADTMKRLWIPSVNNKGDLGRWAFEEILSPHEATNVLDRYAR